MRPPHCPSWRCAHACCAVVFVAAVVGRLDFEQRLQKAWRAVDAEPRAAQSLRPEWLQQFKERSRSVLGKIKQVHTSEINNPAS